MKQKKQKINYIKRNRESWMQSSLSKSKPLFNIKESIRNEQGKNNRSKNK